MSLIESLIAAVLGTNGDGLVMHVGERPFVLSPSGSSDLSERPLTIEAMDDVLTDLLSDEDQRTLRDVGAVEKELTIPEAPDDRFVLVVARGGDDIWIELRRQRGSGRFRRDQPAAPAAPPMPFAQPLSLSSISAPRGPADGASEQAAGGRRETPLRESQPGVVLPLARSQIRTDSGRSTPTLSARRLGLGRLLRIAAARGASSLYLMAEARPTVRIEDDVVPLDDEPVLGTAEVESLILEVAPGAGREAPVGDSGVEWVCDLPEVGRVRCLRFRDQRGPGAVFRLIPTRVVSADQLGLSRDIQALCAADDGLIVLAGPRRSGKSTLASALVDQINRTQTGYIISLESEIKFLHENRKAIVSQREVRSESGAMLAQARAALREDPDVLVIDDLKTADLTALALDAADSGRLVITTMTARTTTAALARLIASAPSERQAQVAAALSESLQGAVAQVLLRKSGGGRVAAREVLFNTPSVAALLAEGKVAQLPLAIDADRKHGCVPMNDALLAFVQSGAVDAREAYRQADNRAALVEQLRREGIDTSFVERLA
ncbi:MAG: ATPase, T2SS/T4P/T4SS family [Acidobacteria bacterium]|nr:ATPase, T2SS/T4P/T4SS family [Acidobacteriota bacterium]